MEPVALVLASGSPRRRELLARLGLPFTVLAADVPEEPRPGERPAALAARLARSKAEAVARQLSQTGRPPHHLTLVLGADTVVAYRGRSWGKPRDAAEAAAMLQRLRGHTHRVITAVALVEPATGRTVEQAETTRVHLRPLTDAEVAAYAASGDPLDKAGAYAIQNAEFHPVAWIDGCYSNVVGLPLCLVARRLAEWGIAVAPAWQPASPRCACARLSHARPGQ